MTEETFARELERRADQALGGLHGAPLTFEDVRTRARGIRRRRRAAAAGAVAALVAVAIVVPATLTGGSDRSQGPDPAPPAPTAPGASVLHDGAVTRPDGSTVPVDVSNANVTDFGVLTDGRVVVALQRPYAVRVFAADGRLQATYPVQANVITMSADDSVAAWVDEDYRTAVLRSGVAEPATMDGPPSPGGESPGSIDAVLDAEHLLVGDFNTTTGVLTPEGVTDLTTSEPLRVSDVSPDGGLWAVQLPRPGADPQFGCSGLYDPATEELVAENCDTSLLEFSPDGRHLTGARGDNAMWGSVEVFDVGLREVGRIELEGQVVKDWGWADAEHVLATVAALHGSPQGTLVRVAADGTAPETVAGPVEGPNAESPPEFILSE
jgi:hypothetical protein